MLDIPADGAERAVLQGGPTGIPTALRVRTVRPADRKVKILYHGGYEHFERVDEGIGSASAVFRWTMRTKIAE